MGSTFGGVFLDVVALVLLGRFGAGAMLVAAACAEIAFWPVSVCCGPRLETWRAGVCIDVSVCSLGCFARGRPDDDGLVRLAAGCSVGSLFGVPARSAGVGGGPISLSSNDTRNAMVLSTCAILLR